MSQFQGKSLSATELAQLTTELRNKLSGPISTLGLEPLAIIGMACRFPGAPGLDAFWQLLTSDREVSNTAPKDRFGSEIFDGKYSEFKKPLSSRGYFLSTEDISGLDNELFKISPREVKNMDPQQRLLMKVAWEAIENAGINPFGLNKTRTGVFVGSSEGDFRQVQFTRFEEIDGYSGTGGNLSVLPGRLSFFLGLRGPALNIDTACSSSLVATHLACQSLRSRETDLFIVGGTGALLAPALFMSFGKAGMLAPDGKCKTFDSSADGYARGEGCGVIVIKRLSDALFAGDQIHGVIRGSGVNHGGHSTGLTVPNQEAQEMLMREVLNSSGVKAEDISYVEAHGTGTPIGDPIEARAIGNVHGKLGAPNRQTPLLIGSVKTHIGHLEAASGVAGIIKVLLAIKNSQIPRSRHFKNPNPGIAFDQLGLKVVASETPWPSQDHPQVAGVNSFGFGGTNSHILIEAPPRRTAGDSKNFSGPWVVPISARTQTSLSALAKKYLADSKITSLEIKDIIFTATTGRHHFKVRKAILASSVEEFLRKLSEAVKLEKIGLESQDVTRAVVSLSSSDSSIQMPLQELFQKWNFAVEFDVSSASKLTLHYQAGPPRSFAVVYGEIVNSQMAASQFLQLIYENGAMIDWSRVLNAFAPAGRAVDLHKVSLPTYAFEESPFQLARFRVMNKDPEENFKYAPVAAPTKPTSVDTLTAKPEPVLAVPKQEVPKQEVPKQEAPLVQLVSNLNSWASNLKSGNETIPPKSPLSPWFFTPQEIERPKLRLFCFPFAGGSSEVYRKWAPVLPPGVELQMIAMPGRDHRSGEQPELRLRTVISNLVDGFQKFNDGVPFAFYGHSMGGMVAFEFANALKQKFNIQPLALVVGGSWPPHLYPLMFESRRLSIMTDNSFIENLRQWGGIPDSENLDLIDIKKQLPLLRADFVIMEDYKYNQGTHLNCPIYAFGAEHDEQNVKLLPEWKVLTRAGFYIETFAGHGHFFINSNWRTLSGKVAKILLNEAGRPRPTAENSVTGQS
jgi:3-oxoacyl-(acyl-carrier-protein) synthase/surfactin synthase thioesterase subunit